MGMQVDEAGRDQFAPGVDLFRAFGRDLADLGDAAVADGDVGLKQLAAETVGDGAAADHEAWTVGHGVSSRLLILLPHHEFAPAQSTAAGEAQGCISLAVGLFELGLSGSGR